MVRSIAFSLVMTVMLVFPGMAVAQGTVQALQLYNKGKQQIDKDPKAAIQSMEAALKADPKLERKVEDVLSTPYCPPLYLGLAYFTLKDEAQAEKYLSQADVCRAFLDGREQRALSDTLRKIDHGRQFAAVVKTADESFAAKRWADVITKLEALKTVDAEMYKTQNIDAKVTAARKEQASERLAGIAPLVDKDSLDEARKLLAELTKVLGQTPEVKDAAARIQKRADDDRRAAEEEAARQKEAARREAYGKAKATADGASKGGDLAKARAAFDQLQKQYPDLAKQDNVGQAIAGIDRQIAQAAALRKAQDAVAGGQNQAAVTQLDQILKDDPNNQQAQLLRGRADSALTLDQGRQSMEQGRYDEAETRFADAVKKDPNNKAAADLLNASQAFKDLARKAGGLDKLSDGEELRDALAKLAQMDAKRFEREGLARLAPPPPPKPGVVPEELKPLFASLEGGDTKGAVSTLDRLLKSRMQNWAAYIHAYVGAGCAWVALQVESDGRTGEARTWNDRARQSFRSALQKDPKQTLGKSLPPPILMLFEEVRSGK